VSAHSADGRVISVNVAGATGVRKDPVASVKLVAGHGVEGDAHAGPWHRQVSLLADESIARMRASCPGVDPGAFGENLTTEGLVLHVLPVGARLRVGETLLEVTQIGKECHSRCAIFHQAGDCVMPREGIFARVVEGGEVKPGDAVALLKSSLIRAAVLTVSDKGSRGDRVDTAGPTLAELAESQGCLVFDRAIVPDEIDRIASVVRQWSEEEKADLILTTGGTGLAPRDVTPEALTSLADRVLPGFGERMRTATQAQHPRAFLTRSIAVTHAGTLIVAFPGSERAVRQCFEAVAPGLRHAVETFKGWEGECGGSVGGGSHR